MVPIPKSLSCAIPTLQRKLDQQLVPSMRSTNCSQNKRLHNLTEANSSQRRYCNQQRIIVGEKNRVQDKKGNHAKTIAKINPLSLSLYTSC